MTADYKRGYNKGYNTGTRRSDAALASERERADRAAERAERAESEKGCGHCDECRHWERPDGCSWGYCNVPQQSAGTPFGCWAYLEMDPLAKAARVVTSSRFGCVLFGGNKP
jgi:hypothetical protein